MTCGKISPIEKTDNTNVSKRQRVNLHYKLIRRVELKKHNHRFR